jgi:YidC/Oxa1 family membrane protein insertase
MLNTLLVLYVLCFNNMGIAIIAFTVLVRLATVPLTLKQIRQMRSMSVLQPKMREVQERYSGDRARVSQETMKMYKDAGVSPLGCLGPLVIQMPILIGLFRVLIQTLFANPDDLVGLADKIYPWITFVSIHNAAPLNNQFLGMNLAEPDPTSFVLPVLVAASTWVQQKNDHDPVYGPQAAVQPEHDAVDDPHFPGRVFPGLAQRPAPVLDNFQPDWNIHPVLHYRMGTTVPVVSQIPAGAGSRTRASRGGKSRYDF